MKLYVCWTTGGGPRHACGKAHDALHDAGHSPEIVKVRGLGILPEALNRSRKDVIALTGQKFVPVLVTDDGEAVYPSARIVEWAQGHAPG